MSKKTLVAYFSATGETAKLAGTIAAVAEADLFEIKPVQVYSEDDLNWKNRKCRSLTEMNDKECRPAIAEKVENPEQYDTVFLGFPIWWYEAPRIIQTFLESYDFSGKTIIPFATSGGSGTGKTEIVLKKSCSEETKWLPGKRMTGGTDAETVKEWIGGLEL